MGMFDYVTCNYEPFVVVECQSKSTPTQMCDTYTITEDGGLTVNGEVSKLTESFWFYDEGMGDEERNFQAMFIKGKLVYLAEYSGELIQEKICTNAI